METQRKLILLILFRSRKFRYLGGYFDELNCNFRILSWEDGYIDYPKPRQPVECVSEDLYCNRASDVSELNNGSVGLVVSDLSRIKYALGEGYCSMLKF